MLYRIARQAAFPICVAVFAPMLACGRPEAASQRPRVAVAVLESARVDAPLVHRSCVGERFCREDVVAGADASALAELDDDCAHRGGTVAPGRCRRDGAVAACRVGGDDTAGTIKVFAYSAEDRPLVAEQCEVFDGTFEPVESNAVAVSGP